MVNLLDLFLQPFHHTMTVLNYVLRRDQCEGEMSLVNTFSMGISHEGNKTSSWMILSRTVCCLGEGIPFLKKCQTAQRSPLTSHLLFDIKYIANLITVLKFKLTIHSCTIIKWLQFKHSNGGFKGGKPQGFILAPLCWLFFPSLSPS